MSAAAADDPHQHQEIIIVKRHGDHEDGHHGGVWKIAFADFMTAMMCFFLVMWLINAANEQTKAAVASYFNPVKLIDRNASKKGLEDMGDGAQSAGTAEDNPVESKEVGGNEGAADPGAAAEKSAADKSNADARSDKHLFADPYAVLAEIASETGLMQNVSAKGEGGAQLSGPSTGASGGESYRDPFAPDFWSQEVAATETAEAEASRQAAGAGPAEKVAAEAAEKSPAQTAEQAAEHAMLEEMAAEAAGKKPAAEKAEEAKAEAEKEEHEPSEKAVATAEEIRKELERTLPPGALAEGLTVVPTERGVRISLTDRLTFGMFEIGSAVPEREMVLAMEKIGRTLAAQQGTISVDGHTDGRPFRSEDYDNWRLSTARAHSAYYMLVRGGLDEKRITEVSGHADRVLKDKADPFAAVNRRIEIELEVAG